jgi:GNAT acetyltransferase-like protein
MIVNQIDPTQDPRWAELVKCHPKASVFHTVGWLQALQRTYAYEPVVFTTSPPAGELKNGLVFCHVKSWLTGRRLVSLPFSDHCEPLCDLTEELDFLVRYLQTAVERQGLRYLEIRSTDENFARGNVNFSAASTYFLHAFSLRPSLDALFRGFDKDCVQRRICRAERAGLVEKCGRSEELLKVFYSLFVATRRRHHLPPTPHLWFQNLIKCQGHALEIRVAYKDGTPISAILTLQFKETVYYKYGCSDARFKSFGATPWLLWRAIVAAKSGGAIEFDLGRTGEDNAGLLEFKNHWAPKPKRLVYFKFPDAPSLVPTEGSKTIAKQVFSFMPRALLKLTGRLLCRHIG